MISRPKNKNVEVINSNNIVPHNIQKLSLKLAEIPLPKFDGFYENWNNFKTWFCSIINSKKMLIKTSFICIHMEISIYMSSLATLKL